MSMFYLCCYLVLFCATLFSVLTIVFPCCCCGTKKRTRPRMTAAQAQRESRGTGMVDPRNEDYQTFAGLEASGVFPEGDDDNERKRRKKESEQKKSKKQKEKKKPRMTAAQAQREARGTDMVDPRNEDYQTFAGLEASGVFPEWDGDEKKQRKKESEQKKSKKQKEKKKKKAKKRKSKMAPIKPEEAADYRTLAAVNKDIFVAADGKTQTHETAETEDDMSTRPRVPSTPGYEKLDELPMSAEGSISPGSKVPSMPGYEKLDELSI